MTNSIKIRKTDYVAFHQDPEVDRAWMAKNKSKASKETLLKRAKYDNRKGRSARRRLRSETFDSRDE